MNSLSNSPDTSSISKEPSPEGEHEYVTELTSQSTKSPAGLKELSLTALCKLYDAWHAAEPDGGYDAKAAEWRAKLAEWQATTQPDDGKTEPPAASRPAATQPEGRRGDHQVGSEAADGTSRPSNPRVREWGRGFSRWLRERSRSAAALIATWRLPGEGPSAQPASGPATTQAGDR